MLRTPKAFGCFMIIRPTLECSHWWEIVYTRMLSRGHFFMTSLHVPAIGSPTKRHIRDFCSKCAFLIFSLFQILVYPPPHPECWVLVLSLLDAALPTPTKENGRNLNKFVCNRMPCFATQLVFAKEINNQEIYSQEGRWQEINQKE